MGKRPAFQFYPGDWRNDAALRMCSLAARGLWIDMLCIMHDAEPYGHLVIAGEPVEPAELAKLVGESAKDVQGLLAELQKRNVFSVTEDGVIYSRRMIRDDKERDDWRKRQAKKRGQEPDVKDSVTEDVTTVVTRNVTPPVTENVTRTSRRSSSSSSPSGSKGEPLDRDARADGSPSAIPLDEWGPSDEVRAWAADEAPGLDVNAEAATFRDHVRAEGRTIYDPDAAFRVWLRRGVEHRAKGELTMPDIPPFLDRRSTPGSLDDDGWRRLLGSYRKFRSWDPRYGPKPGEKGCMVPAHLLEEVEA